MGEVKRFRKPLCSCCTREIELKGKKVQCGENNFWTCPFYTAVKVYGFPTEV